MLISAQNTVCSLLGEGAQCRAKSYNLHIEIHSVEKGREQKTCFPRQELFEKNVYWIYVLIERSGTGLAVENWSWLLMSKK